MRVAALALIALGVLAPPALAQGERPERPYTGIFDAGSHGRASADQTLTLGLDGFFGYDTNHRPPDTPEASRPLRRKAVISPS